MFKHCFILSSKANSSCVCFKDYGACPYDWEDGLGSEAGKRPCMHCTTAATKLETVFFKFISFDARVLKSHWLACFILTRGHHISSIVHSIHFKVLYIFFMYVYVLSVKQNSYRTYTYLISEMMVPYAHIPDLPAIFGYSFPKRA